VAEQSYQVVSAVIARWSGCVAGGRQGRGSRQTLHAQLARHEAAGSRGSGIVRIARAVSAPVPAEVEAISSRRQASTDTEQGHPKGTNKAPKRPVGAVGVRRSARWLCRRRAARSHQ
jgi:hypothetical protein